MCDSCYSEWCHYLSYKFSKIAFTFFFFLTIEHCIPHAKMRLFRIFESPNFYSFIYFQPILGRFDQIYALFQIYLVFRNFGMILCDISVVHGLELTNPRNFCFTEGFLNLSLTNYRLSNAIKTSCVGLTFSHFYAIVTLPPPANRVSFSNLSILSCYVSISCYITYGSF